MYTKKLRSTFVSNYNCVKHTLSSKQTFIELKRDRLLEVSVSVRIHKASDQV